MKKNIFYLLTIALMGLTAVSCGEDDEPEPAFSVSPTSLTFALEGGTQNIAVTAENTSWTATTDANWLTLTKTEGSLSVTATAHTGSENRTGIISITSGNDKITLNITQKGTIDEGKVLRQVAKVECISDEGVKFTHIFKYDTEGRIAEYIIQGYDNEYDNGYEYYFSYNIVDEVRVTTSNLNLNESWILYLNKEGYADKIEKKSSSQTETHNLSYINGYLSKEYCYYNNSKHTISYEWNGDGNFLRSIDNDNGDTLKLYEHHNKMLNNTTNIDLNIFNQPFGGTSYSCNSNYNSYSGSDMFSRECLDVSSLLGFIGKRSANFVNALVYDEASHIVDDPISAKSKSQIMENLSFELDKDGYIVKITSSFGISYSITYNK